MVSGHAKHETLLFKSNVKCTFLPLCTDVLRENQSKFLDSQILKLSRDVSISMQIICTFFKDNKFLKLFILKYHCSFAQ